MAGIAWNEWSSKAKREQGKGGACRQLVATQRVCLPLGAAAERVDKKAPK